MFNLLTRISLTKSIAECGGGKWYHTEDSTQLAKTVTVQITELQKTVITNPQLELNLMDGAKLLAASITKPVNQNIDLDKHPEKLFQVACNVFLKKHQEKLG